MVPAHGTDNRSRQVAMRSPELKLWVRGMLLIIAASLVGLFVLARRIAPYDASGQPLSLGTHRQLGLPPCQFMVLFGRPCPTCGMTTSFALLMHGDLIGSLRANFAGTLLAIVLVVFIPWTAVSALRGRWVVVQAAEWWILTGIIGAVGLAVIRWAIVVGVPWLFGYG
ncbi:MAG: DUF2752 domain-containing protein [Gemmataceae bacterium]